MGRTQKPLTIGVTDPDLLQRPELQALAEKGHHLALVRTETGDTPDLILGPRAWYMDEGHLKYLDVALKAARKVKYTKSEGER